MPVNLLEQLPAGFDAFLQQKGLIYSPVVQADLLAAVLSSQFIIFAGPSGTGKSSAATALAEFFTPRHRRARFEVGRQWIGPGDLVGEYSSLAGAFVPRPALEQVRSLDGTGQSVPFLIFEEANLSAIEGYLNHVIQHLSHPAQESIEWPLHTIAGATTLEGIAVPERVRLEPFPRFLATVNIDATAPAPAKKVSGRACVVLLEPRPVVESGKSITALWPATPSTSAVGQTALGDPREALGEERDAQTDDRLSRALDDLAKPLVEVLRTNPVSERDLQRSLLFISYFVQLAANTPDLVIPTDRIPVIAAENALLHFVLPGLTGTQFAKALGHFATEGQIGGLLRDRSSRLLASAGEHGYGVPIDFWASLS